MLTSSFSTFYPKGLIIMSFYSFSTRIFSTSPPPRNLDLRKESDLGYLHLIHLNVNANLDIDSPRGIRMLLLILN